LAPRADSGAQGRPPMPSMPSSRRGALGGFGGIAWPVTAACAVGSCAAAVHSTGHGAESTGRAADDSKWFWAYMSALAMSAISFVGASMLVLLNIPRLGHVVEYSCLFFAGTVLVADALMHLLPHALEDADHDTAASVGIVAVAGCMSVLVIPEALEWTHGHAHGHGHGQGGHGQDGHGHGHGHGQNADHGDDCCDSGEGGQVEAFGVANLVTEMLHNFVDGISLGLAFAAGAPAGISTAVAVAVHELPQELGDFMVLRFAGFPVGRLLFWNFLVSLTCVGGVAMVHAVGQTASGVQRYLTAFTGGSFLSLALNMIFPQVSELIRKHNKGMAAVRAKALCGVLGVIAVFVLLKIGELEGHDHEHEHEHEHGHGHSHGGEIHAGGEL